MSFRADAGEKIVSNIGLNTAGRLIAIFAVTSVVGLMPLVAVKPAKAASDDTQKTALSCGRCDANSKGSKLTTFRDAFASNRPSKVTKKGELSPAAASAAAESTADFVSGRALDYVPWSLHDPYYSHFLYKSDDYRD